jgi:hypothetical protein
MQGADALRLEVDAVALAALVDGVFPLVQRDVDAGPSEAVGEEWPGQPGAHDGYVH